MNKSKKIFVLFCILFIIGAAAFIFFASPKKIEDIKNDFGVSSKKITMYYAPITNYFSNVENVSRDDLIKYKDSGNLFFEKGEKGEIVKILGNDFSNIPEKELGEVNLLENQIAIVRWDLVKPKYKTLKYNNVLLWNVKNIDKYSLKGEINVDSSDKMAEFETSKVTVLKSGGDVMLSRHVATKIRSLGVMSPWQNVSGYLSDADITFLNLEVPLSDRYPPPTEGMSFIAPTAYIEGLIMAGVDIASVANNHSANFGQKIFLDNLETLNNGSIAACGGGLNDEIARTPNIVEKNGVKFGFLCYNSVTGGLAAGSDPGMASLFIEPWYRDDEESIKKVEDDIKRAKKDVDVLIVSPHWGVEYKLFPSESQKKVAKRAIDAGADLILGTHPHVVQGSEIYNDKYITYSMGNLIFDQEWSQETKEGVILETYFYDKKNVSVNLVPIEIKDYHQPYFTEGSLKEKIIERIKSASVGF